MKESEVDYTAIIHDRIRYPFSIELRSFEDLLNRLIHHETCKCCNCESIRNKLKILEILLNAIEEAKKET